MSKKDKLDAKPLSFRLPEPTREEDVTIHFEFDYSMYLEAAPFIKKLCGWEFDAKDQIMEPGDSIHYVYSFSICYFGNVERNLDQALTLLGQMDTAMIEVDSELLDKTSCLLARVVEKLRQIQTMIAPREA